MEAVAEFFGVDYQTVRRSWKNQGMPGRSKRYRLEEIARWLVKYKEAEKLAIEKRNGELKKVDRFRDAKAELAEITLRERKGELIDREAMHESLIKLSGLLRGAGERLQRAYGKEAQLILDETLDEFDAQVEDAMIES